MKHETNNLKFRKIKVISSIPGRIRINISGLLRNEKIAFSIGYELAKHTNIVSFHVSKNSGNVLIYYKDISLSKGNILILVEKALKSSNEMIIPENIDRRHLIKILIDAMNPLSLFRKKHSKKIYEKEYSISNNILKNSIGSSSIIFLFTSSIGSVISALILGYPGILFAISAASYYYASTKLKMANIYLKSNSSLTFLNNIDTLLVENDVFQDRFHNISGLQLSKYDIHKLTILNKIDNPVNCDFESLINNIRILGVNNIFIIGNSQSGIIQYISYLLGVEILDINNLEKKQNYLMVNKLNNTVSLTTDRILESQLTYFHSDLIICLYRNKSPNILNADINLEYSNMNKLPFLMELSYFCREINTQTQNIATTLNILGILLVTLEYLTPLSSIFFYILNTFVMTLTLKLRFKRFFSKSSNKQ
ncbi:hypothetical protein I6U48_21585 [Clostridium sp. PL3]|uniref:Uncharacterized protein n=1 Tax=Clostridium thailandense TaxID=2794346 RepID=A0A949TMA3_9CLOT|nr:hypothetical protein [Clostridium thailandense]MBV7275499.1 hypothetical protein [Clostridium thailandense]